LCVIKHRSFHVYEIDILKVKVQNRFSFLEDPFIPFFFLLPPLFWKHPFGIPQIVLKSFASL
jgi:hypothetical protein